MEHLSNPPRHLPPSQNRSGIITLTLSPSLLRKIEQSTRQDVDNHLVAEKVITSAGKSIHDVLTVPPKARPKITSVEAETRAASAPMSSSESWSTQISSSGSTRPQRLRRTPKATVADVVTKKPLNTKQRPKKRTTTENSHTEAALSSTSMQQPTKKRKLSIQHMRASRPTISPNDTLHESAATSSSPSVRVSPDVRNRSLRGSTAISSNLSLQQALKTSRNGPQITLQPSSGPQKVAEKPKSGPRIKSYDAALEKAIERADTAERQATEAERRVQELEQDAFARKYESFETPPTHKFHTAFEKQHQLIQSLQTRLEKHEVTTAKKKGEIYAHIAYRKELKASLAEKDKDIKDLKTRQDTLTMAVIGRDADIAEKDTKISQLQKQLDTQDATTSWQTDDSRASKITHKACNNAARAKDADIQSLKDMNEECDAAIESLNARLESLAAQAKIDKSYLAQKDDLLQVHSEKHELERSRWMKTCQNLVQVLINCQRVGEDLDSEVKRLRQIQECDNQEVTAPMKEPENETVSAPHELRKSQTQPTMPRRARSLAELQDEDRKSVASMLVTIFAHQAEQAQEEMDPSLPPGQTAQALSLTLGLGLEHAIHGYSWAQSEKPSSQYFEKSMAVCFYMGTNTQSRDSWLDRVLLPHDLFIGSQDKICGDFVFEKVRDDLRTTSHSRASNLMYEECMQRSERIGDIVRGREVVRNESTVHDDNDEHGVTHHGGLSKGCEAERIEQLHRVESRQAVRNEDYGTAVGEDDRGKEVEDNGGVPAIT